MALSPDLLLHQLIASEKGVKRLRKNILVALYSLFFTYSITFLTVL